MKKYFTPLLIFCTVQFSWAMHIIGGSINMKLLNQNGNNLLYEISISLILDETTLFYNNGVQPGNYDAEIPVNLYSISRKSNINSFKLLPFGSRIPVLYKNSACAKQRNLKFSEAIYKTTFNFTSNLYNDPEGYKLVWETCCRSSSLSNIQNRQGMVFYLIIPPMFKDGKPFINSSPSYLTPNGDYICLGKPFKMGFNAVDNDKDELRYSLDEPLAGFLNGSSPAIQSGVYYPTYPTVAWLSGYNGQNAIHGSPPLQIDETTGVLSIVANEIGLFVFSVKCEEFRNGIKIGETRRDFQLPVVDCPIQTPPVPIVLNTNNQEVNSELFICDGVPLNIKTNFEWAWSHQWQKDGFNIPNANTNEILIVEPGIYTVSRSFSEKCSNDTISKTIKVLSKKGQDVIIMADRKPFCEDDSVSLASNAPAKSTSNWFLNNVLVGSNPKYFAQKAGKYILKVTFEDGCYNKDSIQLVTKPKPEAKIFASSAFICDNDSLSLTASSGTNFKYEWFRNGKSIANKNREQYFTNQEGIYTVKVTDNGSCKNISDKFEVKYSHTDVSIDSIPPICGGSQNLVLLNGRPAGGFFSGKGIFENKFDPKTFNAGKYEIVYTYTNQNNCKNSTKRLIAIDELPQIVFKENVVRINVGESVKLENTVTPQNVSYIWTPTTYLSTANDAIPSASPVQNISYLLTVTTNNGCQSQARISVLIGEEPLIPDVFTPNEDGINDNFEILNANVFNSLIVNIYNRWGEQIFYSEDYTSPWNGYFKGQKVQPGAYVYQIIYSGKNSGKVVGVISVLY